MSGIFVSLRFCSSTCCHRHPLRVLSQTVTIMEQSNDFSLESPNISDNNIVRDEKPSEPKPRLAEEIERWDREWHDVSYIRPPYALGFLASAESPGPKSPRFLIESISRRRLQATSPNTFSAPYYGSTRRQASLLTTRPRPSSSAAPPTRRTNCRVTSSRADTSSRGLRWHSRGARSTHTQRIAKRYRD